ncbi:methyl-accepting chemotaxis protein [Pantoea ananatis]|jgi:methyl-accepting chemotaxis protein|uniref:Trg n=2 Tax=Pantoea ananas TaxID=553 RepID=D4GMM2_PANAM|nr:methyl-accepting chemotaxis protein [Pantoea ananatis]ADD76357.1 Trg [Pantoea ananatis LMG 20103]AER33465.1 methyl-accepting chemotaxis protein III Trg [Pantoea ananatis PA13]ERM11826.1 Trg [Pantoea ananatis BRT175]PQK99841.1 methyl-accepting chemotaxis protein [Pantoea ananatis]PQL07447.1 methyl-accepting chemotaxis protein [Pantoea ananatis]
MGLRLENTKIAHKLSLGFGLVLLLVVGSGSISVLRFKNIRDVYEQSTLIYDINIDVFQAKVNRLKLLYGDEKAGKVMADYIAHASQLTQDAQQFTWQPEQQAELQAIASQLSHFQSSITTMTQAVQTLAATGKQLDQRNMQSQSTLYEALIKTQMTDASVLFQQLLAISQLRDQLQLLRYDPVNAATLQVQLEQQARTIQSSLSALLPQLPPEAQTQLNALWSATLDVKQLSERYAAGFRELSVAESAVKTDGDKSSAIIKMLLQQMKAENSNLTHGSINLTLLTVSIAVLLGILIAWLISRQITAPVRNNLLLAERIASGDLSADIKPGGRDELSKLAGAMGAMNHRLRTMIQEVRDSVFTVSQAASSINSDNHNLSSRTEQQAAAVVQTAASMEQLTVTVKHNADNARHASQIAAEASLQAEQGGAAVSEVVQTMGDISASSKKIAEITAVINSIAFQTNILALNAAVEAARAGEQGRGFAVVASEVRNLSQRSAQAAKDIEQLISASVGQIAEGNNRVARAGERMGQVVNAISRVNHIVGEISSASDEQSRGIEQIARAVSELDSTTQQNASLVSASALSANALEDQALRLETLLKQFNLEPGQTAAR